jgi:hypothetical protein
MPNNYVARGYRCRRGAQAPALAFDGRRLTARGNVSDGPDAAPVADAPDADPRRCGPNEPSGSARPLIERNSDANDDAAWLTSDELTIYSSSMRADELGGFDIDRLTRTPQQSSWKLYEAVEPLWLGPRTIYLWYGRLL